MESNRYREPFRIFEKGYRYYMRHKDGVVEQLTFLPEDEEPTQLCLDFELLVTRE